MFKQQEIPLSFLKKDLEVSVNLLQGLYDQGTIPNNAVPLLEDRLTKPTCFCGASISDKTQDADKRRSTIEELISQSKTQSKQNSIATELFFRAQNILASSDQTFSQKYQHLFEQRQQEAAKEKDHGKAEAEKEAEIANIPQQDLAAIRTIRDTSNNTKVNLNGQLGIKITEERRTREDLAAAEKSRDKLMAADERGQKLLCEFNVATDLELLLKES